MNGIVVYGDCTTYAPIDILNKGFAANKTATLADMRRWFLVGGYGPKRADYWINQFQILGLIEKNRDGVYKIAKEYAA